MLLLTAVEAYSETSAFIFCYILSTIVAPDYSFPVSLYTARDNENFEVTANFSSNPPLQESDVIWRRNNMILSDDDNIQLNVTTLYIQSVTRSNSGNYSVTGNNSIGVGSAMFELDFFCEFNL